MPRALPLKFYRRDTVTVARELLGCTLVHMVKGERLSGRIIETEAYLGAKDRACHTFGGRRTERTLIERHRWDLSKNRGDFVEI